MKLSDHFEDHEFQCRCGCGFKSISPLLVEILERVRAHYGYPINVESGCRCVARNKAVGGEKNSMHLRGLAADFWMTEIHPFRVYDLLDEWYPDKYGIGKYFTFTHFDVRNERARWGA